MRITKVWFDENRLYGLTDDGRTLFQSLLYFPRLLYATEEERNNYTIGSESVLWEDLNEEISFDCFDLDNPEPEGIAKVILSHRELNVSELARRLGMDITDIALYITGGAKPTEKDTQLIIDEIKKIGRELQDVSL